jgi:hypothetical protein
LVSRALRFSPLHQRGVIVKSDSLFHTEKKKASLQSPITNQRKTPSRSFKTMASGDLTGIDGGIDMTYETNRFSDQ